MKRKKREFKTKAVEIDPEGLPEEGLGLDEAADMPSQEDVPEYTESDVPPEMDEQEKRREYPLTEEEAYEGPPEELDATISETLQKNIEKVDLLKQYPLTYNEIFPGRKVVIGEQ